MNDEDEEEGENEAKANLPTLFDQALGHGVVAKASISAQARGPTVANGSMRGDFKSSMKVVITSPTKRPRTHVRAQAVSNRTCDAACFAAQEGETTPYIHTDD